ncbi:MAG: hypothetical protein GY906_04315 [bacterium]|nr:hypothetical protein [bacterium]
MTTNCIDSRASSVAAFWSQAELAEHLTCDQGHWRIVRESLAISVVGSVLFGCALGAYALSAPQLIVSAIKVPLLLLGTTILCFPAFWILQSGRDGRPLTLVRSATVQALALATTGAIWGALALPLLFLVTSTAQYGLAQVLALAVGGVGGLVGMGRFLGAYRSACAVEGTKVRKAPLALYSVLFATVGMQLAWVLRPFIGDPGQPFETFRHLGGNMFSHILGLLGS